MGLIKDLYIHYRNLLARLDADGDLTQTPIFDRLEREWAERGFAPIGK